MTSQRLSVKISIAAILFVNAALLLYGVQILSRGQQQQSGSWRQSESSVFQISDKTKNHLVDQIAKTRNELSKQLNQMSKKIGQMQCEKHTNGVNEHGGWCKDLGKESSREHKTDTKILPALSDLMQGKRVGSFGDGPGVYKREMLKLGKVASYDAYDGAPYCEETSEGQVEFMDLTIPQYGRPMYDWVISLEVAEHIPKKYEDVYLDNVFRHAKEGIVLSWAVPGQNGVSHINNKPFTFVVDVMKKNGFVHDQEKSKELKNAASFWWLRQNVNVYRRENFSNYSNESILSQYLV